MWKLLPGAMLLLTGVLGCRNVQPSDVVGTWTMMDRSRRHLPVELQGARGTIIVNADGSFVASELPEVLPPTPRSQMTVRMRLSSGRGSWRLASWERAQHLHLEFRSFAMTRQDRDGSYGLPLTVSRGWSRLTLYYALGDPDEGRRAEFEKR